MEQTDWVLVGAGCDYVTATAKTAEAIGQLKRRFDVQAWHLQQQGFHVKPSRPMGYDGWQVGPWFGGARQDGFMLRVSGQDAHDLAAWLLGRDVHVTRLDLQATFKAIPARPGWAAWCGEETARRRAAGVQCNWAAVRHLNAFGKGDTLTVGSRTSDKYGRLYDKEAESMDASYEGCWRYELEYKGCYAPAALAQVFNSSDPTAEALGLVLSQWRAWCVPVPVVAIAGTQALVVDRQETDVERRLNWLRRQVVPTLRELDALGYREELDKIVAGAYNCGTE